MMKPLANSITALCFIAKPSPAFGEGDGGDANAIVPPAGSTPSEDAPDFSFIDRIEAGEAAFTEPAPEPNTPAKEPAEPKPKEEVKPPDPKPKEEVKPKVEEKKTEEKPPAEPKKEEKVAEGVVPKKEEEPPKLPSEEDIEKMQPKPGSSSKFVADWNTLKGHAKVALGRVKSLEAENAELKKKAETTVVELPEDVKKKLERADADRKIAEMFELDNDPVLKADFEAKLTAADEALFTTLKKLGLPETADEGKISIASLKAAGLDSDIAQRDLKALLDVVAKVPDPLAHPDLINKIAARKGVIDGRTARIEELRNNSEAFKKEREEKTKAEQDQWGKAADAHLAKIYDVKNDVWGSNMAITDTMTAAEKAAAEAHNKALQEETIPKMREFVQGLYGRNPEKTMEAVYKAMRHDWIAKEFATYKATAEKEKADAAKRIEELTKTAAGVRRVSSAPNNDTVPPDTSAAPVDESAEAAIDRFRAEKGI